MRLTLNSKQKPVNTIEILGERVASIDMKGGWEVSEVYFQDDKTIDQLDELFLVLRKNKGSAH